MPGTVSNIENYSGPTIMFVPPPPPYFEHPEPIYTIRAISDMPPRPEPMVSQPENHKNVGFYKALGMHLFWVLFWIPIILGAVAWDLFN